MMGRVAVQGGVMGSLSVWHWALVALAFFVLFGARKLPDLARSLGQSRRILKAELTAAGSDKDQTVPPRHPTAE